MSNINNNMSNINNNMSNINNNMSNKNKYIEQIKKNKLQLFNDQESINEWKEKIISLV